MDTTKQSPFSAFLRASQAALEGEIVRRSSFSPAAEPEAARRAAQETIAAMLDALDALDATEVEAQARLSLSFSARTRERMAEPGWTLSQALGEITLGQVILLDRARAAVAEGVEGAWEGIARLASAAGLLSQVIAAGFTEAKEASTRALADSEKRFRELYRRTPAMMHAIDTDMRVTEASDRWLEVMGYTRDEVIGRSGRDFLTEASRELSITKVAPDLFDVGECRDIHYQYATKDGQIRDIKISAVVIRDEEGKPLGAVTALVDETERMRAERALRESEERYRVMVDRSPLGIVVHCDDEIVFANNAAAAILDANGPAELIGRSARERIHPDDRGMFDGRARELAEGAEVTPLREVRLLRLHGGQVQVAIMGTSVQHEGRHAVQAILLDISERARAREAMQRSALQDEIIRAQEESLLALSTPLIPVSERVLVMPLVGRINEARTERILEVLLSGVTEQGATHVILDVTGVPEADAGMADALIRASQAVNLLGAKVILTGIRPAFAKAMIDLGVDVGGLVTRATLSGGIRVAMGKLA